MTEWERGVTSDLARAVVLSLMLVMAPAVANAQVFVGGAKPRPGSAELSGGGFWMAGHTFDSAAATLTSNPSSGSSGFDLFTAEPVVDPAFGLHGALAVYLTRNLAIEGGVQFSRPKLKVTLTDDAEDADDVTATETITSYVFTGSLVYHFATTGKTVPFIAGGAGHIRDLHAGNELVETGVEYHGKVGIKSWFGRTRKYAFRAEGGISIRDGGFSFDDGTRIVPIAAASLLYLF
jgi:hypothetical protein